MSYPKDPSQYNITSDYRTTGYPFAPGLPVWRLNDCHFGRLRLPGREWIHGGVAHETHPDGGTYCGLKITDDVRTDCWPNCGSCWSAMMDATHVKPLSFTSRSS